MIQNIIEITDSFFVDSGANNTVAKERGFYDIYISFSGNWYNSSPIYSVSILM